MRWRGAMLDISRHYFDKAFIIKLLNSLAIFDYNVLHLHLTDDQGWRLESRRYPLLHEIGSIRPQSQNNHAILAPTFDGVEHSGYLTQADVREIIEYARALGIEVVPEINIPAHTGALLAAYPQFGINRDAVNVGCQWGISDKLLKPFPEVFEFLSGVFLEISELFPSEYIHVGGDESLIDNWLKDPEVVEFMHERGFKTTKEVSVYFMQEIETIILALGRKMITWDDAFAFDPGKATSAAVMSWRGVAIAQSALNHGRDVIQGPVLPTYFDYSQELSTAEPLAIGGAVTLDDVLAFTPLPGVLGVQFQLWTEYVSHPTHAEYMMWPRAAALAFRCWGKGDSFESYFESKKDQLLDLGVAFRDLDPSKRLHIANLGIGEYHEGHPIKRMVEAFEKSASVGEIAQEF